MSRHGRDGNRWIPCARRATAESAFCRSHRDALNGVILGLWVHGYPRRRAARGFSWGLMHVMGQVAREAGFDTLFLSALCDPEQGLAVGCKVLRKKFDAMARHHVRAARLERRRQPNLRRASDRASGSLFVICL